MKLTKEILERGRSVNGAFNAKQLTALGLDIHNLWKGWQKKIIGNEYTFEAIETFLLHTNSHLDVKFEREFKEWMAKQPKNPYAYTDENKKTINEAKSNLIEGLRKIDCND